jgi:hypothetical protein
VKRIVLPELLDVLPPEDPRARRSRRDLRRLNALMGHPAIMARALQVNSPGDHTREVIELGAGDGHFLLKVAARLNGNWQGAQAILLDRLPAMEAETQAAFAGLGWQARAETAEVTDFLRAADDKTARTRTMVSNLFLHQFDDETLKGLLARAAQSCSLLIALEPRRGWWPQLNGRLLWFIGCGPVTRHDAQVSIRAGFTGNELTQLWPDRENWRCIERPAGLFSHLFIARRIK